MAQSRQGFRAELSRTLQIVLTFGVSASSAPGVVHAAGLRETSLSSQSEIRQVVRVPNADRCLGRTRTKYASSLHVIPQLQLLGYGCRKTYWCSLKITGAHAALGTGVRSRAGCRCRQCLSRCEATSGARSGAAGPAGSPRSTGPSRATDCTSFHGTLLARAKWRDKISSANST